MASQEASRAQCTWQSVFANPQALPVSPDKKPTGAAEADKASETANACFAFTAQPSPPNDGPWEGICDRPGWLRLVAIGTRTLHVAVSETQMSQGQSRPCDFDRSRWQQVGECSLLEDAQKGRKSLLSAIRANQSLPAPNFPSTAVPAPAPRPFLHLESGPAPLL